MSTLTVDEVRSSLPELLARVRSEPVIIREGEREVAVIVSREDYARDQLRKVESFERARDAMVMELATNLAKDGMTVEQFVRELMA